MSVCTHIEPGVPRAACIERAQAQGGSGRRRRLPVLHSAAIPDILMRVLALPTPWLARRVGRDRVILAALVPLVATTLTRAVAGSSSVLWLTTAGVGAGIAIAGALTAGFVKATFPQRAPFIHWPGP